MSIKRQRNSHSVRKRICRKAFIILFLIGVPTVIFLFAFGIKKVDIVGETRYTKNEIKEMVLKSPLDYNSVYLYLKYRFLTTPEIPFIEKLDIEKNSNHKVTIYVYEKMVTGCVNIMGEYLYFDKDGIVVESSSKKIEKVPVIDGLQFDEIVLHEKLNLKNNDTDNEANDSQSDDTDNEANDSQSDELFDIILNITRLVNKYELDVNTVKIDENENITLICNDIKVLLGKKSDYEEALSDMVNILKTAKDKELYELDMRDYDQDTDIVIGKTKNSTE